MSLRVTSQQVVSENILQNLNDFYLQLNACYPNYIGPNYLLSRAELVVGPFS